MSKQSERRSGIPAPARERVKELRGQGWSARDIALEMGITTQAVYKHLAKLTRIRKDGAA